MFAQHLRRDHTHSGQKIDYQRHLEANAYPEKESRRKAYILVARPLRPKDFRHEGGQEENGSRQ